MKPDFRFPIYSYAPRGLLGWWLRFCARQVCRIIAAKGGTYQFGAWINANQYVDEYVMINSDYCQLIHWILVTVGYSCCTADIMERCGHFAEDKQTGLLQIKDEKIKNPDTISKWIETMSSGEPS